MSFECHNSIEDVTLNTPREPCELAEAKSTDPLFCEMCNVKVTSDKILQRHLEGRRHKTKAERKGKSFECELCDVVANSEIQLNIHLKSLKHKNKLLKKNPSSLGWMFRISTGMWLLLFCMVFTFINLSLFKIICK